MRISVVLGLVAALGDPALADSKQDVQAIAQKAIVEEAAVFLTDAEVTAKGVRVKVGAVESTIIELHGDYATAPGPHDVGIKPRKVEVVVDEARGIAWFHGRADAVVKLGKVRDSKTVLRVTGLAVKDKTWKVAALSFTDEIDDKGLIDQAQSVEQKLAIPTTPVTRGDAALVKVAAKWFAGGFAAGASKGKLVAIGTAEKEYTEGAAATKLAGGWDKLKLAPYKIEAKTFANGTAGFVRAVVALPVAKKKPVPMVLSAIVVQDGGEWRWVALNWNAFSFPPTGNDIDTK